MSTQLDAGTLADSVTARKDGNDFTDLRRHAIEVQISRATHASRNKTKANAASKLRFKNDLYFKKLEEAKAAVGWSVPKVIASSRREANTLPVLFSATSTVSRSTCVLLLWTTTTLPAARALTRWSRSAAIGKPKRGAGKRHECPFSGFVATAPCVYKDCKEMLSSRSALWLHCDEAHNDVSGACRVCGEYLLYRTSGKDQRNRTWADHLAKHTATFYCRGGRALNTARARVASFQRASARAPVPRSKMIASCLRVPST